MEYLAHYDKEKGIKQSLEQHLRAVATWMKEEVPPVVSFNEVNNSLLKDISYWMGFFHDFGKYTDYFQVFLVGGKNSVLKQHAHISGCFLCSFLLDKIFKNMAENSQKIICFLCYLSVALHHQNLDLTKLFTIADEEFTWKRLKKIAENLKAKHTKILQDLKLEQKITMEEFLQYLHLERLQNDKLYFSRMPQYLASGYIQDEKWFFVLIWLFSNLIDKDKLDSAGFDQKKTKRISDDAVIRYLNKKNKGKQDSEFANRREKARREMLSAIDGMNDEEIKNVRFFTLTAPTGIGKTLSSLQCVLRLREKIEKVEHYTPRIITAIPFINIIEQNKKEYENVFEDNLNMVIHHRLADFSLNSNFDNDNEELALHKALLEVESWEADIVLTTFVQLFQSIFSNRNKLLKKINKLAGSIVILDEAQAIPEKYMALIGATLQKIGEYYGTRFVLMTATQPKLLEFGDLILKRNHEEIGIKKELLIRHKEYFKDLDRTKFVPSFEESKIDTDKFIEIFMSKWEKDKSALIVANTISRSIQVYQRLKKHLEKQDIRVPVYYLSTNIIPRKRRQVIEEVGELLSLNKPVILVSTQTIEAGVDLDFDMAFRDFAPIDSLIQTAGRVNREGKKGKYLPIYIVEFEKDNQYVYELFDRQSTKILLKDRKEILESEYGSLAEKYYDSALKRGDIDESIRIWEEGVLKLQFDVLQEFKLIDNIGEVCDIFVEDGSDRATDLANAYEALLTCKEEFQYDLSKIFDKNIAPKYTGRLNTFERKALLKLISAKMSDYIIQARVSKIQHNQPVSFKARGDALSTLYWIPPGQLKQYYDEDTGFISENGDAFIY